MTKTSLLNLAEQIRIDAESAENYELTKLRIIDLLLDYIGNAEIREKIESISFI